jgi:hypothetical protein
MGMFDDLVPKAKGGMFDDLIPSTTQAPAIQPTGEPTAEEIAAASKPAFLNKKQFVGGAAKPLETIKAEAEAERAMPKIDYEQLYKDPVTFKTIADYGKAAGNEYKEGQSKEEYAAKFMANMRGQEWNVFSNILALNKLKNAPMDDKVKLAEGQRLFDKVKSATEVGGQPGAAPYLDIAQAALTDITNYIGFGVATAGKKMIASQMTKAATTGLKATPAIVTAASTAAEATVAVGQNVAEQKKQQAVAGALGEEVKPLDITQVAVAALFGSIGGFTEAKGTFAAKPGKTGADYMAKNIDEAMKAAKPSANPNAPITKAERTIADPVAENMDAVVEEFMNREGGKILDEVNPATALTDSKIQKDLSARAVRVALHIIDQDPTFRVKPNQKTSTAIAEVFSNLDNIDDAVLEQAIRKEGLTPDDFAKANKLTVTEAAQVMQQYSAASKVLKRLTEIDPAIGKQVDELFGKPDEYVSAFGRLGQMISTVERESKAWVVSGIGTTVRNVIGTGVGLAYNSAASLIEGSLYTVGRTLDGAATGKRLDTLKNSLSDTMKDAFSVYGYMAKNGLSTEVTDTLLQHNPTLRGNLLSATQENATNEVSKAAQIFNTLNVAQDAFFRKAIFSAAVEKHMRRAGLDMYQTIGEGKVIPASILKQATDDTLKATFSYAPKAQKKGIETLEAGAENMANLLVKAAEFPGGSLIATFPRFMSNAIAFQYRYSVFGAVSGAEDLLNGALMNAAGSNAGAGLVRKGQENIAKGVVGTAALAAAYDYRLNNQDADWYNIKNNDGSTIDTRSIFPLGPTLAVADFLAKRKLGLEPKTAEAVEAIAGMKMPAGTQNQFLDQVFSAFSSEKDADKLEIAVGKVLGDFTARFSQPFLVKSAYEFLDLFREGGAVQRDPNVIKSEAAGDKLIEAAVNRVQSKLPIVKEALPEAIPRLREGPVYKEGEFFNSLIGVRVTPEKTPAEQEIVRLGIDPYKLYGPSSGDKQYDRAFVENANPLVIKAIDRTTANERYKALTPTEQKIALTNVVRDVTSIARDKTDGKFMSEDLLRIKKMQFNNLTNDQRKVINERYAKEHEGKTLEETNDYMQVDKYEAMLGNLQFAKGGLVPSFALGGFAAAKLFGKKAATTVAETAVEGVKKLKSVVPTQEADNAAIDAIINKALPPAPTTPAAVQTKAMLSTPPAVKAKPAPLTSTEAPTMAPEMPTAALPEEALPTPASTVSEAPMPSKAFEPEDYVKGEQAMMEMYTPEQLKSWKIASPEDYENTLHSFTGQAKGIKYSEMPPAPYAKKADESASTLVDEVEYDDNGNPISIGGTPVVKKVEPVADEYGVDPKYLSGDMNLVTGPNATNRRNEAVSAIKEVREDAFFKMRNNIKFASIDDDVLGVVLGDYRYSRGVELNPKDSNMMDDAIKLANKYQKRLDVLREKYKDVPAVKLFHGQGADENIDKIKRSGFMDPSKSEFFHSEMMLGAPSFTRDLNLGFRGSPFGGTNPKNYVVTEIPYADYVFNKINMAPEKYDSRDMNTILRAVTGAPGVVRPIGLPRAGYLETEDMMLEAEKLNVKGRNAKLRSAEKDVGQVLSLTERPVKKESDAISEYAKLSQLNRRENRGLLRETTKGDEEVISEYMTKARIIDDPKQKMKLAYMAYGGIKDLMNSYLDMAAGTSTKTGVGQQYQAAISTMADYSGIQRQMREVGDILWDGGAKQKAQNLYDLSDKLKKFQQTEPVYSTAAREDLRKKSLDEVRKMTPKLRQGGFISKRQYM